MSGAPTLPLTMPLPIFRRHLRFTLTSVTTRSWGAPWVTRFKAEIKDVDAALGTETTLVDTLDDAETHVTIADGGVDRLARQTYDTAKLCYSGKNLKEVLGVLFKGEPPSEFTRPALGEKLEAIRVWPGYLKGLPAPQMQALASPIEAAVKAADAALVVQSAAEAALQNFRGLTQAPLTRKVNGMFQGLLGDAHTQAKETGNPGEAQGLFLLTEQRRRRRAAKNTLARAQAEVAAIQRKLAEAQQNLAELQAIAAADAQAAAERRALDERIATLNKKNREIEAEVAALEKERDKDR